ncbi:type I-E CRISPR-associated protein Cse1/CasA [Acetobacter pasteurianus]|nr:type I-E CRISPR-associated protein Cse1/CasA [Acetobacter pasteurianus]
MNLNLITDPWIPVRCSDGSHRVIAPWQMAEDGVVCPDWPRTDLNIACYELLIGLVYLADPPKNLSDWKARKSADPDRLRKKLEEYSEAFNLLGDGPRFLQDLSKLDGVQLSPDLLFLDSAGAQTIKNNADVMVRRYRYDRLTLPEAAMALYSLQSSAASGGSGNRTSMRGGGPLTTIVNPEVGLWDLVCANTPYGTPSDIDALPWMRETVTSQDGVVVPPPKGKLFNVEAFFGMPRRIRLVSNGVCINGVIQKTHGTNYVGWEHPLSPYYKLNAKDDWRARHPGAGKYGYHNWLGTIAQRDSDDLSKLALSLRTWVGERGGGGSIIVAGWSMDNAKPRNYIYSQQRLSNLSKEDLKVLTCLIDGASSVAGALTSAFRSVIGTGEDRSAQKEEFFLATEKDFFLIYSAMRGNDEEIRKSLSDTQISLHWLTVLRKHALKQFDQIALPGMALRDVETIKGIVLARKFLGMALYGYGKQGEAIFNALGLPIPASKKSKKVMSND